MDSIEDHVRAEAATELERLGSDRGLIALTDADLSAETIRERIANVLAELADVFEHWASEENDPFQAAATDVRELADTVADETVEPATDHPLVAHLRSVDGHAERVGAGLVGASIVLDGWALQGVSFFVNEADRTGADEFRDVRSGLDTLAERGEAVIGDERETAVAAALELVDVVYADYVETLDGLGLDPKTVC